MQLTCSLCAEQFFIIVLHISIYTYIYPSCCNTDYYVAFIEQVSQIPALVPEESGSFYRLDNL